MGFPNLVSLSPKSKIKRAKLISSLFANTSIVFTGDCGSLREDERFSKRMRCVACASKNKNSHDNRPRLKTMTNTVPLFFDEVSNARKSYKRTVKEL